LTRDFRELIGDHVLGFWDLVFDDPLESLAAVNNELLKKIA